MTLAGADKSGAQGSRVVLLGRYSGEESIYSLYDLDVTQLTEVTLNTFNLEGLDLRACSADQNLGITPWSGDIMPSRA